MLTQSALDTQAKPTASQPFNHSADFSLILSTLSACVLKPLRSLLDAAALCLDEREGGLAGETIAFGDLTPRRFPQPVQGSGSGTPEAHQKLAPHNIKKREHAPRSEK